jgi:DNA-binding transcriptional MerR regulator
MAQQESTRRRHSGAGHSGPGGPGLPGSAREIPDKLYFRIGEVAKLCAVPAYVLRFWEGEFPQLKPNKGGTGQRLYRRRDVEMALRVKTLLYDEGYTIAGARQALKLEQRTGKAPTVSELAPEIESGTVSNLGLTDPAAPGPDRAALLALKKELTELHGLLSRSPVPRPAVQAVVQAIRPSRIPAAVAETGGDTPMRTPTPFARPKLVKPTPARVSESSSLGLFDGMFPAE